MRLPAEGVLIAPKFLPFPFLIFEPYSVYSNSTIFNLRVDPEMILHDFLVMRLKYLINSILALLASGFAAISIRMSLSEASTIVVWGELTFTRTRTLLFWSIWNTGSLIILPPGVLAFFALAELGFRFIPCPGLLEPIIRFAVPALGAFNFSYG